jgi:hypothetical protein
MTTIIPNSFLRISRGNFSRLQGQLRRAREEAQAVYAFIPNSYTNGLRSALTSVENTLDACFGPDEFDTEGHDETEIWGDDHGD